MSATVAAIWRYPIKGHGREALQAVTLSAGATLPWDRHWAVAHEAARLPEDGGWAPCVNFCRGAKAPALMAIEARFDEASGTVTLTHPERGTLAFQPETEAARFLDWVRPLMPEGRAAPVALVRGNEARGWTDTDFPSVSLNNLASHRAVEQRLGRPLSPKRWRGNFWIEGLAPWEEFEWLEREIRLGTARLKVRERIVRCLATTANPDTGRRDADTLGVLEEGWGHRDFGVYAEVIEGGRVAVGDAVELI
ncbi:MAG: MOSC domain-containing protein [Alphaproteobacteria bacterium]|nr:MAG: MOSC domain-containing protein [Alphaproteobacteria bacterium]